ncbi:MAG: HD domain-containing protein [Defluviitaleaceae bacterium]|nr:HD domain-containing protein [Defluviitaleaceae bacterium]
MEYKEHYHSFKENITLNDVMQNMEIKTYIQRVDMVMDIMGYTDHSSAHTKLVAENAANILKEFGYSERDVELARIAGYTHDIGNCINRNLHAQTGATIMFEILTRMQMPPHEIAPIVSAIGHHDEKDGIAVGPISAALIIADKADVRRSRVKNEDFATFDIHDRVNYAVENSFLEIDKEKKDVNLRLKVDLDICSITEYFEIFLTRMMMSAKATEFLNGKFHLIINDTKLL